MTYQRDRLVAFHGEKAVALGEALHEAAEKLTGDPEEDATCFLFDVSPLSSDAHGLNFVAVVEEHEKKRVIITSL